MKLLIGHDGSASADAIFDDLKHAGLPRDSEALVVSVADFMMGNPPIREMAAQVFPSGAAAARLKQTMTYSERLIKEAEDFAARAADRLRLQFPEWTVHSKTETGTPALEIMDAANRFNADLIIVGSQGRSRVGRLFLGSVSKTLHPNCWIGIETVTSLSLNSLFFVALSLLQCRSIVQIGSYSFLSR